MTSEARKARKKAQQRQDILLVARELLMAEGYGEMSMRKLAKAADCAAGTLYLYFKDKDHIVSLLIEESFESLMVDFSKTLPGENPLQRLYRMMRSYVSFGLTNPHHYQVAFLMQRTQKMDEIRSTPHRSFAMLQSVVAACIDDGTFRQQDAELATQGLWTNLHGITSLMITMPRFPWTENDQVIEHVLTCAVTAISATADPLTEEGGKSDED